MSRHGRGQGGFAYVLALLFLTLFGALSLALSQTAAIELRKSKNQINAFSARMAAESGMAHAVYVLRDFITAPTLGELPQVMSLLQPYLSGRMPNQSVQWLDAGTEDERILIEGIPLGDEQSFDLAIHTVELAGGEETEGDEVAMQLHVQSIGHAAELTQTVSMRFDICVNKEILHYAMASAPRLILRGRCNINGDIATSWARLEGYNSDQTSWPVDIGSTIASDRYDEDIQISGDIKLTMSHGDFDDAAGWDGIRHEELHEKVAFDEPQVMDLTHEDFDTSVFRDDPDGVDLALPSTSNYESRWGSPPANPDEPYWRYENPLSGTTMWRAVYENHKNADELDPDDPNDTVAKGAFHNLHIPRGSHARFVNCQFTGVTYIDTSEDHTDSIPLSEGNVVTFENCTFEGPIVTAVPKSFRYNRNSINFEGNTEFRSSMIQETLEGTTLMAPNFNVNVGDFNQGTADDSDSKLVGILVGGIVDIRDNAVVEGTILAMANLDHVGDHNVYLWGSNVGNWELTTEGGYGTGGGSVAASTISITPDPDNVLPLGMKKRYIARPTPGTYHESAY